MNDRKSTIEVLPWSVQQGKTNDGQWAADLRFTNITDGQWAQIRELIKKYSLIRIRLCPAAYVSDSGRKIQFRLGHAATKPTLVSDSERLTSTECSMLRDNLINCGELCHKQGVGLWHFDPRLVWKVDGMLMLVPSFWLPAIDMEKSGMATLAPEYESVSLPSDPSESADIFAIASLCFQGITGQEYHSSNPVLPGDLYPELKPWDAVLDPALRKNPSRRPAALQDWARIQPQTTSLIPVPPPVPPIVGTVPNVPALSPSTNVSMPSEPESEVKTLKSGSWQRRKWILTCLVLLVVFIGIARTVAPGTLRRIPVLKMLGPSYQRGTGSYVVSYADRSYDRAKWTKVWSTENVDKNLNLSRISGWDKDNLAVSPGPYGGHFPMMVEGHWVVKRFPYHDGTKPLYAKKDLFFVAAENRKCFLFNTFGGYTEELTSGGYGMTGTVAFQPEADLLYVGIYDSFAYEIKSNVFNEIRSDEKKFCVWRENNTSTKKGIGNLSPSHSFKEGRAIAYNHGTNKMARYENGLWYDYMDINPLANRIHEMKDSLWAIDENNFIFVSRERITVVNKGIESHQIVDVSGWGSDDEFLIAWGVDLNKYWIMDSKGNVAQYENGRFRGVVRGPKLKEATTTFQDAWASPEGVVYAITGKEVYRLD